MATQTFQAKARQDSVADFLAWAKGLSDALKACGVVLTNDTGQINWAGVAAVPAINTYAGYEIFRITMPQGTSYLMKIEYGSGNATFNPALRVQFARTSDGAGNLTGDVTQQTTLSLASNTATLTNVVSGDATRFGFYLFADATAANAIAAMVGRSKSDAGADTDEYINIVLESKLSTGTNGFTGLKQQMLPKVGPPYPVTPMGSVQCAFPPSGNGIYGVNAGIFPIVPNVGFAGNPTMEACVYSKNDQPVLSQVDVQLYGASHRFICCYGNTATGLTVNGNNVAGIAMRFE